MKKYITLIMALFMVAMLAGCAEYTYEEKEIVCEVVECVKGEFVPNATYTALATKALASKDMTKWLLYKNLAQSTGVQEYKVTVIIEDTEYILTRDEPYEVGAEILVKQYCSYCDGELVETTYS